MQDILAYEGGATLTVEGQELGPGDLKILRDFQAPAGTKPGGWLLGVVSQGTDACASRCRSGRPARAPGRVGCCAAHCCAALKEQTEVRTQFDLLARPPSIDNPPCFSTHCSSTHCTEYAEEMDAAGDGEVLVVMDLRPDDELLAAVSHSYPLCCVCHSF